MSLLFAFLLGFAMGLRDADQAVTTNPHRIPGGIAAADGVVGYVAGVDGSAVAVELKTGREIWKTAEAGLPLGIAGDRLATWRGSRESKGPPHVVVLNTSDDGKVLRESQPLIFPDWVIVIPDPCAPEIPEGAGLLAVHPSVEGRALRLTWHASARSKGGAGPPRGNANRSTREASGVILVDFDTGAVKAETGAAPVAPSEEGPASHPYRMAGAWRAAPFTDASRSMSSILALSGEGAECSLTLKRRDAKSGREQQAVVLSRGPVASRDVSQVTPDGSYLFLHHEYAAGEAVPARQTWRVISVAQGREVATLPYESGAGEVAVVGSVVLYRVPAAAGAQTRLQAVDLHSGAPLWSRPLPEPRAPAALPARRP